MLLVTIPVIPRLRLNRSGAIHLEVLDAVEEAIIDGGCPECGTVAEPRRNASATTALVSSWARTGGDRSRSALPVLATRWDL
jgi:hypothetical protein